MAPSGANVSPDSDMFVDRLYLARSMGRKPRRAMKGFMRILPVLAAALALAAPTAHANPRDWPQLEGGAGVPECQQALELGRIAFHSRAMHLYEPVTPPDGFASTIVLRGGERDGRDRHNVVYDESVFERIEHRFDIFLFAQRAPSNGSRLVVSTEPYGWRGDTFTAHLVPAGAPPNAVRGAAPYRIVQIAPESWPAPMVLRNSESGALWLIALNGYLLAPWEVHAPAQEAQTTCTVRFAPEIRNAFTLLPEPVREFATLVDGAMGTGIGEGTLNPTARNRGRQQELWANAVYRPWGVVDRAYNTRAEVDAAMRRWARQAPSFRAHYDALLAQYPRAEAALADYYAETFGIGAEQADTAAAYVIETGYISAYTFHREDYRRREGQPNPWPDSR